MKNFFRQNGLLLVLIALLLSVLIGVGSALLGGNTDPLSNVVNTVASPIRGGVSAVMDWAEGVYTYVFHYQELHDQLSWRSRSARGRRPAVRTNSCASCSSSRPSAGTSPSSPPR